MAGIEHYSDSGKPDQPSDGATLDYAAFSQLDEVTSRSKRVWWRSVYLVLTMIVIFLAGRGTSHWHLPSFYPDLDPAGDNTNADDDVDQFSGFVKHWNDFVISRDGYIPEDPYSAILQSGVAKDFDELRAIHFAPLIPPRINPNLEKNPKWIVFWKTRDDVKEVWACYGDGTWDRKPFRRANSKTNGFEQQDALSWANAYKSLDFPAWTHQGDRDAWVATHHALLKWDSSLKMYVVHEPKATTQRDTRD